jgi:MscS family membrane protein
MRLMVRAWLVVLALLLLPTPQAGAAGGGLLPELDTSSPRATYQTFLAEMARIEGLYATYRAEQTNARQFALLRALLRVGRHLFDLGALPPATRDKHAGAAVGYLADILKRLPPIPPDSIPGTPPTPAAELPAHWTIPGTELRMRRLTEGPWAGSYVFTAETLARLPDFHAAIIEAPVLRPGGIGNWRDLQIRFVGPLLAGVPLASLPAPFQAVILGTPLWKAILSLLVILGVAGVLALAVRLVRRWAAGAAGWRRYAAWLTMPVLLALLAVAGEFLIAWEIGLGGPLFDATALLTASALYGAAAWAAWLGCHLAAELVIALPAIPDNSYDAHLLRLLARVASVMAVAALLVYGASTVGVPVLGLVAGVGVGGIALALAAQSSVENLFGGISIFADRPFRVGDHIQGGGVNGVVEAVGPRSSRIRGLDGTLTTVPNGDLAKMHITNFSARNTFLFRHTIRLGGETTRARLQWLLEELRRRIAADARVRTGPDMPRVRLVDLGDASIDVEVFAHVPVAGFGEFLAVQEALILEIMGVVEEGGMRFIFAPAAPAPEGHDAAPAKTERGAAEAARPAEPVALAAAAGGEAAGAAARPGGGARPATAVPRPDGAR